MKVTIFCPKYFSFVVAVLLFTSQDMGGQVLVIGESKGEYVRQLIKYQVESYYNASGNHSTKMAWDTKYKNGAISDVIICYEDQYLIDFRLTANYCKHYIIEAGILSHIVTQYENISFDRFSELIEIQYGKNKVGDKYFTDDYKHYYEIYLADNSQSTAVYKKALVDEMPLEIREAILAEQNLKEEKAKKADEEAAAQKAREKEIKSKLYDLEKYDESEYNLTILRQRARIIDALQDFSKDAETVYSSVEPRKNFMPSFKTLDEDGRIFTFKNTYSATYKLQDNSTASKDYGFVVVAGSRSIKNLSKVTLESGEDSDCILFSRCRISIVPIKFEGYEVMTTATLRDIYVSYIKGVTTVRIKNGKVTYKKNPPTTEFEKLLSDKLAKESNGLYKVKYEAGQVMDDTFVHTDLQQKKSAFGKVLGTTALVALVLVVLIL